MDKPIPETVLDRACDAYVQIADDCMGLVRRKAMRAALTVALGDARRLVAKLAAHVRPTCSELWDEAQAFLAAEGVQAGDGCHCATCTCEPNMTPAVRFDLSPAQQEGAIREHLIRLGWTPPAVDRGLKTCYQCNRPVTWLAPDSRCVDCTRLTPDEVGG